MSLKASVECRKFAPNIFNRSKCQNCFRGKDAHSPEALESNRATRKVSCCGYLFVAPDWDFSLAANRNKRWQRRWFVLYDDGELAYSVDEHPETVPQSVIDMTRVLEVADAEGVTGNPFALALTCPDKVHFVKGTSKEETKKWFEVLSKFPRNTVCGKYKRNATFPCIKSAPVVKIETPVVRRDTVDGFSSKSRIQSAFDPGDDLYPTKDTNSLSQEKKKEIQNESMCLREESKILLHNPVYLVMSDKKILEQPFRKTVDKWEELKGRTIHKSASVPDTALLREDKPPTHQVRGDPDGCNPDSLPPYSSPPDFPPDDQFLKKGWLVKQQSEGGGWSKHWFVLRNCALAFYADPIAEEAGVMDGVIDLRQVRDISPGHDPPSGSSSSSSFTFCIQMKDSNRLLLSAVSAKIRSHWVRALASATAPPSPPPARNALSRVKARSATRNHRCPPDASPKEEDDVAAKERLEEASWAIWLDVAKFCRGGAARGEGIARVEERLQAVQAELAKGEHTPTTSSTTSNSGGVGSLVRSEGETVRRLQTQVRAAQAQADCLELWGARARAAAAQAERLHASQMALMAARVEDLTAKLLAAERQVRQLRQRVAKLETRRRSSLKGKEALTLSKEYEAKLSELEGKIEGLLGAEEEEVSRDSLLARLHALDRRVTDAMPKIRLQVESSEDKWNSLSLSTSMTDLSSPTPPSPEELWEELVSRVASLEAWVRSNLPDHHLPSEGCCPERSLHWLQDAASDLYRQAHFQQYRSRLVVCHLRRLELALEGLELFMEQHPPTLSLCALSARLSSSHQQKGDECGEGEEEELWRRVGERRARVRSLLSSFKGRSLERLCAALRELAEEPPAQATQAHFLQHVVAQVANSFTQHTARCLFPWLGEEGAEAAQGALAQLSLELRELRALPPGGCGVLLEYARCAVGQLARVVAVAAMAEAASEQLASLDFASRSSTEAVEVGVVVSLCDPDELGVSHRSVSSLLCFKRKWKDKQHCRSCTELRQEVSYLQGELEESRAVSGALCEQTEALRVQQELQFNEEKKNLEKELQTVKNNLKKIELHYDAEVGRLQQEYEAKLQQKNELSREDSKLLFATEMEQLKGVCERGLSALDAAHGKALSELERRHQRELHEMANERQRALADEARATALALEAVRSAHSEELKKQIQNFKEEFVLKMNKKLETEAFRKCYEADLGSMKCEIMSMTEKYSAKCLENATLHEKLEVMNQQLNSTTTQLVELLARNQQLRARLTSAQIQKQEESVL